MKFAWALGGALVVGGGLVTFACVGSDDGPVFDVDSGTTSDSRAPGSDSGTQSGNDGGTDSAAPKPFACALQTTPPLDLPIPSPDAGTQQKIDGERFKMILLDDGHSVAVVANIASTAATAGTAGEMMFWIVDTSKGSPSPLTIGPIPITGDRVLDTVAATDGVALVTFGHVGTTYSYYVEKFADADLLGYHIGTAFPLPAESLHAALAGAPTNFTYSQGAGGRELAPNDYAIVGTNENGNGGAAFELVAARINAAPVIAETATGGNPFQVFPDAVILNGTDLHVFGSTSTGQGLAPSDYLFNATTLAAEPPPINYPNDLLIASTTTSSGVGMLFATGDLEAGLPTGFRIGTATTLAGLAPETFGKLPTPFSELPFADGADIRFWTFPSHDAVLLAGGPLQATPGLALFLYDVDGTTIASAPGSATGILGSAGSIVGSSFTMTAAPNATGVTIPMAWVVRSSNVDTVSFSKIVCAPAP